MAKSVDADHVRGRNSGRIVRQRMVTTVGPPGSSLWAHEYRVSAPVERWAVALAKACVILVTAFGSLSCEDPATTSIAAAASARGVESESGCRSCSSSETCIVETIHSRSEEHCAVIVVASDIIDNDRPRRWQEAPNVRDDVMGTLVVLKGVKIERGPSWQTDMACAGNSNCCNQCGTPAVLSGFGQIPIYDLDGEAAGCGGSCCKQECSPWLPKEEQLVDVAGRFESGFGSKDLRPGMYFRLAALPEW